MRNRLEHELLLSQLETQEYSFSQISAALHDNIGQLLSTTKLLLGMTVMELTQPPDTLKTAEQTLAKAITDLRSLSKTLHNGWLPYFDFVCSLKAEKERINVLRKVQVEIISDFEKLPMEPGAQVILFRVVCEALQDIIKRHLPDNINVQLKNRINFAEVIIENNSNPNAQLSAKKHAVPGSMQRRIQLLGGSIKWQYRRADTYCMLIKIPVNNKELA
ncbi:sensor histidine kinase [Parafilimonas sp.]|uniref:sensor histidine kinase n=1 Tax=Parafilimonas sp. TaxID=1969739 RepID=UPI0039E217FD